jgi:hypothetical protein
MHEETVYGISKLLYYRVYHRTLLLLIDAIRLVRLGTGTLWRCIDPVIPDWSCCFSEDVRVHLTKAIMSVLHYTAIHCYRTRLLAEENLI